MIYLLPLEVTCPSVSSPLRMAKSEVRLLHTLYDSLNCPGVRWPGKEEEEHSPRRTLPQVNMLPSRAVATVLLKRRDTERNLVLSPKQVEGQACFEGVAVSQL